MENCIFCKIVKGDIPKDLSYEDEFVVAFEDLHPMSPLHLLVIPKVHIEDFFHSDESIRTAITSAIKKLIDKEGLMGKGYRITVNGGGAQDINHLHFHLRGHLKQGE